MLVRRARYHGIAVRCLALRVSACSAGRRWGDAVGSVGRWRRLVAASSLGYVFFSTAPNCVVRIEPCADDTYN